MSTAPLSIEYTQSSEIANENQATKETMTIIKETP